MKKQVCNGLPYRQPVPEKNNQSSYAETLLTLEHNSPQAIEARVSKSLAQIGREIHQKLSDKLKQETTTKGKL